MAQKPSPEGIRKKGNARMASLNKVLLIGNLGRDPEVRYMLTDNGKLLLNDFLSGD